jgi:hypothetical protein
MYSCWLATVDGLVGWLTAWPGMVLIGRTSCTGRPPGRPGKGLRDLHSERVPPGGVGKIAYASTTRAYAGASAKSLLQVLTRMSAEWG